MSTAVEGQTQPVLLMLADISGYTRFMVAHAKELRHSETIIRELMESLIEQVDVPLRVAGIEGDALFLYAVKSGDEEVWKRRGASLVDRLQTLFDTFAQRKVEIGAYSVCRCNACRTVGDLKLKVIAHSGEAVVTQIGGHSSLSGPDVITVHRLAKNSVPQDQYMLMTESAFQDLGAPEGVDISEGVEEIDTGTFNTYVFVPKVEVREDSDFIRSRFSDKNAAVQILRDEVAREYTDVAQNPDRGYHFNTGRGALSTNGYRDEWLEGVPEDVIESFAGTGNPFAMGMPAEGEYVVDVGCGAGLDGHIAANAVGLSGHVIGVEMTDAMLEKAQQGIHDAAVGNFEVREGYSESLPVPDGWADLVISNGSANLSPDKSRVFGEMFRVLRPGGRLQVADITVERPVPESAKANIDLWTN
jgi:SAM-dependent methyltransferase